MQTVDTMPHRDLVALRAFSGRIGRDRLLIQGAGGNTSIKIDGTLHVKASGTWLRDAETQDLFLPIPLDSLRAEITRSLAEGDEINADLVSPAITMRPSIETIIHGILPRRVVVHVHSVNTIAHAILANGEQRVAERLAGLSWRWIPYARPGGRLATRFGTQTEPAVFVLANHGLVIQATSVDEADALLTEVERRPALPARPQREPQWEHLAGLAEATGMTVPADPNVHAAALDTLALEAARRGAPYPDHVVYLGSSPLPIATADQAVEVVRRHAAIVGALPVCLVVADLGVLVSPAANRGVEPMLDCLGMVLLRLDTSDRTVFLTADDEDALVNWDHEKHRMKLAGR